MNDTNSVLSGVFAVAGTSRQSQDNISGSEVVKWTKDILIFNVCRICVTYHDAGPWLVSIFTKMPQKSESYADLINQCLPIQVSENDQLPSVVCRDCAVKLLDWHSLVQTCKESAKTLSDHAERLAGRTPAPTSQRDSNNRMQQWHFVDLTDETDAEEEDEPATSADIAAALRRAAAAAASVC